MNPQTLKLLYPDLFRQKYAKKEESSGEERWVTIGGQKDEEGKRKGGFPVLIGSDGEIKASAVGGLHGKNVSEVKGHFDAKKQGKQEPEKQEEEKPATANLPQNPAEPPTPAKLSDTAARIQKLAQQHGKPPEEVLNQMGIEGRQRDSILKELGAGQDDDFQLQQQSAKGQPKFKHELTDAGAGNTKQQAMFDTRKGTPGQGEMFDTDYEIQDKEQQQKHAEGSGLDTPAELKRKQALGETLKGKEPIDSLASHISTPLGVTPERIKEYFKHMQEFDRKAEAGEIRGAREDRHPEHSHAGRMTDILDSGQLQIRERIREWANKQGVPLHEVYDMILGRSPRQKYSRRTSPAVLRRMYPHFFRQHIPRPVDES